MRALLLAALLLATLAIAPVAAAEPDDEIVVYGPMNGKCIAMRGLTGFSITLANCLPSTDPQELLPRL